MNPEKKRFRRVFVTKTRIGRIFFMIFGTPVPLLALIAISMALIPFKYGMETDEGIWNYIARMRILYDLTPYNDLVENKPPGIFYIFYISNLLFGLNLWFPRLAAVVSMVSTSAVMYLLGKLLHNKTTGLFSMLFFGMMMSSYMIGAYTVSTESFMVFFSTLAFLFVVYAQTQQSYRQYVSCIFTAGLSMGCALAFKQIALADMGALFLFYCLYCKSRYSTHKSYPRDILLLATGVLCTTALSILPILADGVPLEYYIQCVWELIFFSGTVNPQEVAVKRSLKVWFQPEMTFFYVAFYWFAVKNKTFRIKRISVFSVLAWVAISFLAVNSAGTFWWHHLQQFIAPMSLVIALTLSVFADSFSLREDSYKKAVCLCAIATVAVFMPFASICDYINHKSLFYDNNPLSAEKKEMGLWLKEHTAPEDSIYIYESTGQVALAYSDRKSSSRHFSRMFLHRNEYLEELMRDITSNHPRYLLVRGGRFFSENFRQFITEEYKLYTKKYGYNVFEPK
ncbi:MAG: glycosyltransferase family 39 protein [Candidatus Auribacterota bacterium]|nr:glycosyltransferase family 39 protein [Candidatus Auribacterota bacterium]